MIIPKLSLKDLHKQKDPTFYLHENKKKLAKTGQLILQSSNQQPTNEKDQFQETLSKYLKPDLGSLGDFIPLDQMANVQEWRNIKMNHQHDNLAGIKSIKKNDSMSFQNPLEILKNIKDEKTIIPAVNQLVKNMVTKIYGTDNLNQLAKNAKIEMLAEDQIDYEDPKYKIVQKYKQKDLEEKLVIFKKYQHQFEHKSEQSFDTNSSDTSYVKKPLMNLQAQNSNKQIKQQDHSTLFQHKMKILDKIISHFPLIFSLRKEYIAKQNDYDQSTQQLLRELQKQKDQFENLFNQTYKAKIGQTMSQNLFISNTHDLLICNIELSQNFLFSFSLNHRSYSQLQRLELINLNLDNLQLIIALQFVNFETNQLSDLCLSKNEVTMSLANVIKEIIEKQPIKYLDLSDMNINIKFFKIIALGISKNDSIENILLNNNQLDEYSLPLLEQLLKYIPSLINVNITNNQIENLSKIEKILSSLKFQKNIIY